MPLIIDKQAIISFDCPTTINPERFADSMKYRNIIKNQKLTILRHTIL